jgi:hypothetical protein
MCHSTGYGYRSGYIVVGLGETAVFLDDSTGFQGFERE